MLIVHKISPTVVPYFMDGRTAGRWTSSATRLLELPEVVTREDLNAVLRGQDPRSGRFLPQRRRARRRAGWDLIFSAPKSVSLLHAGDATGPVHQAHQGAVDAVLSHIESRLLAVRTDGTGRPLPGGGLIAARVHHEHNAAQEPHLHTHALVANLTPTATGWGAIKDDQWSLNRQGLAALYQLSLRRELELAGLDLEWRIGANGLADVASVPSAAVRAASTPTHLVASVGRFSARRQAQPQPWPDRVRAAGLVPGPGPDGDLTPPPGRRALEDDPGLTLRVTSRLAARRSDFRQADVIAALAATHAGGATPQEVLGWVDQFCRQSRQVASRTSGPRWTTALARRADDRLVDLLTRHQARSSGSGVDDGMVTILGAPPGQSLLLAHSDRLDRQRAVWASRGLRAAVDAPTAGAGLRWQVLTGLLAHRPGIPADIIVVDQADRRTTAELLRLVESAGRASARLVLVEGGTMPRLTNPTSHGFSEYADTAGRVSALETPVWGPDRGRDGDGRSTARPLSGREAAGALLTQWTDRGRGALLVGLGLDEVLGLNAAAAHLAGREGTRIRAPGHQAPGRLGYGTGDRVVVLRAGERRPPFATFGSIASMDLSGARVDIRWDGADRPERYGREVLAGLGPGWAATPSLAARAGRPVMLLGPEEATPRLRSLVQAATGPGRLGPEHDRQIILGR